MKEFATLADLARELPAIALPARESLVGHDNLFAFSLDEGPQLFVRLQDGLVTVTETADEAPVCTVYAAEKDLLDLMAGRLNPAVAFMMRKVRLNGNPAPLMGLMSLLGKA